MSETLSPREAEWLVEFARTWRAAVRAVSLYPAEHPAIAAALARLVRACQTPPPGCAQVSSEAAAPAGADIHLWVLPDRLLLDRRGLAQPDQAVTELARLLHDRRVGELRIASGITAADLQRFLGVLARTPETLREDGGIARVWTTSGGQHVALREIDYGQLLRERPDGYSVSFEEALQQFLRGDAVGIDAATVQYLLDASGDSQRVLDLLKGLHDRVAGAAGTEILGGRLGHLLDQAAARLADEDPERAAPMLENLAEAAARLPVDTVVALLTARPDPPGPSSRFAAVLATRLPEPVLVDLVERAASEFGGAPARLGEALRTLIPDPDRLRALLARARHELAGRADAQAVEALWRRAEELLLTYSDARFVSAEYAGELSRAQHGRGGGDVDERSADPPERIAAWLGTVAEREIRSLDRQLLVDLLQIEDDPASWAGLVPLVVDQVRVLISSRELTSAVQLLDIAMTRARAVEGGEDAVATAIGQLAANGVPAEIAGQLATIDDGLFAELKSILHRMGPPAIAPLAEALARERRAAGRARVREVLRGYGRAGRQPIEQLKSSPDPEVRRTAVLLLRELGGQEDLPDLARLLHDADARVQQEAIRTILAMATPDAYATLTDALRRAPPGRREAILRMLAAEHHSITVPALCYIVRHLGRRGGLVEVYQRVLEAIGGLGAADPDAAATLKEALYQGQWWAPRRTALIRTTAARALHRLGSPDARTVLQDAAATGPRGVRAAVSPYVRSR